MDRNIDKLRRPYPRPQWGIARIGVLIIILVMILALIATGREAMAAVTIALTAGYVASVVAELLLGSVRRDDSL